MDSKHTALVTGATGMLGARLVFDLLKNGDSVKAIYRNKNRIAQFTSNVSFYCTNPKELTDAIEWIPADVLNYEALGNAFNNVDIVYHLAAMVSFHKDDLQKMYDINIKGTANVVNACIKNNIPRICFVSSIAALGKEEGEKQITENTPWNPDINHSEYQISKFYSEKEIWNGIDKGLDAVIVNPSVILGPGEWHSGSPAFFSNIYKGMPFYPKGATGFIDVRDVSKAMLLLTNNENWGKTAKNRFLLSAENRSYKYLFTEIAISMNVKPPTYLASSFLMGIGWRAAWLMGKIKKEKPLITKGSVTTAKVRQFFDGRKITCEFDFEYTPLKKTITDIGKMYLNSSK